MISEKTEHDAIKKYKVARIFNLSRPVVLLLVWIFVLCAIFIIIDVKSIPMAILLVFAFSFTAYWIFLRKQRWVTLKEDAISYEENVLIRFTHGYGGRFVDAEFTVSYITHLELEQTCLEQSFNMGHIRIKGHTEVKARERYVEQLSERRDHVVYGILNFSDFRQSCQELFSNEIKKGEL